MHREKMPLSHREVEHSHSSVKLWDDNILFKYIFCLTHLQLLPLHFPILPHRHNYIIVPPPVLLCNKVWSKYSIFPEIRHMGELRKPRDTLNDKINFISLKIIQQNPNCHAIMMMHIRFIVKCNHASCRLIMVSDLEQTRNPKPTVKRNKQFVCCP